MTTPDRLGGVKNHQRSTTVQGNPIHQDARSRFGIGDCSSQVIEANLL